LPTARPGATSDDDPYDLMSSAYAAAVSPPVCGQFGFDRSAARAAVWLQSIRSTLLDRRWAARLGLRHPIAW